jgi:hypothetical protein
VAGVPRTASTSNKGIVSPKLAVLLDKKGDDVRTRFVLCAILLSIASTISVAQQVSVNYNQTL